jgi:hypothetical protein
MKVWMKATAVFQKRLSERGQVYGKRDGKSEKAEIIACIGMFIRSEQFFEEVTPYIQSECENHQSEQEHKTDGNGGLHELVAHFFAGDELPRSET